MENGSGMRNLRQVTAIAIALAIGSSTVPAGTNDQREGDLVKKLSSMRTYVPLFSTETWSGGDNNDANWTSNGNWSGIGGAGPNDDLVFPAGAARTINTNDFPINTNFNSLTFKGRGYDITGNQIFLTNGMTASISGSGNPPAFNPNIILGNSQVWKGLIGVMRFEGVINLNGHVLSADISSSGGIVLAGAVNGNGSILKTGAGILSIGGHTDNLGQTTINAGRVHLSDTGELGTVLLNGGTLTGTGTVRRIIGDCGGCAGTVSPGPGSSGQPGGFRVVGPVALGANTNLSIDIASPTLVDQLIVIGNSISLGGADLELSMGFTPTVGQQFTIVSQSGTGSILGQFNQGTGIVDNGQLFTITYNAHSVVLTAQGPVVP